ncbi:ribosomal protein S18-alanine N-acetyltransferase [Hydrogenobaculum acidophilum]
MTITEMTKEHLDEVIEINNISFTTDAWNEQGFYREFSLDYSKKWVGIEDGKVVVYAIFWCHGAEAFMMTFAVHPDYRSKGVASYFLTEVFKLLKEENIDYVELDVRKSNLPAINLYKKLGFKIERERPSFYSDGENAFVMSKELV